METRPHFDKSCDESCGASREIEPSPCAAILFNVLVLLVTGYLFLVTGYLFLVAGYWTLVGLCSSVFRAGLAGRLDGRAASALGGERRQAGTLKVFYHQPWSAGGLIKQCNSHAALLQQLWRFLSSSRHPY